MQKQMISSSKRCAELPIAGRNTQQVPSFYVLNIMDSFGVSRGEKGIKIQAMKSLQGMSWF